MAGPGAERRREGGRPASLSLEDAGRKGSRPRLQHRAEPGRGGDGAAHSPSDRERRARRAVTGRGRAEPSRLSSKRCLRGRPAASSPRPELRSLAPPAPPPKMASPAPSPPHNAARRDVTRPRAAGRGSGKLRRGSSSVRCSSDASGSRAVASGPEALPSAPQAKGEGEEKDAKRPAPTFRGSVLAAALDLRPARRAGLPALGAPGPHTAAWHPS